MKKLYILCRTMGLVVFPVRKAGFKMLYLWYKQKISELHNFIYYKIIKVLLANIIPRAFLPQPKISQDDGQLRFTLNYEL
jgi:hypothetical protein